MPPNALVDHQWFMEELYPYESMLRAWLISKYSPVRNHVDDIIQESYIRVLQVQECTNLKSPKAFLFATARNLAIDLIRRDKIISFDSFEETECSNVVDMRPDMLAAFEKQHKLEILTLAIQSLPKRCQQVFTLRKVYGLSHREISEKLQLSMSTIESQISIGMRKCKNFVKAWPEDQSRE